MKHRSFIGRTIIFLLFNFLALYFGALLMNEGPQTIWYMNLNKASWTPVGWFFGVAWSSIMLCFSFYMAKLSMVFSHFDKELFCLYTVQWLLNVGWNYIFFNQQLTQLGLLVILLLWLLIGYFTFKYLTSMKWFTFLIAPYFIWIAVATSLNLYIVLNN